MFGLIGNFGSPSDELALAQSQVGNYIPYGWIFGHTILVMAMAVVGLFLGLWLMGKLFKSEAGPLEYFNVAVASQVPMICAIIVGLILSYISFPLGLLIINLGFIMLVACVYQGCQKVMNQGQDKAIFALPLAFLVMYLFVYIAIKIFIL